MNLGTASEVEIQSQSPRSQNQAWMFSLAGRGVSEASQPFMASQRANFLSLELCVSSEKKSILTRNMLLLQNIDNGE